MATLARILLLLTSTAFSAVPAAAGDTPSGYVRVMVEYRSLFPGTLQVQDNVCRNTRSIECAKAGITVAGDLCRRFPQNSECKEAQALLETSFCIEGLVHEGRVAPGEKITVLVCASEGGYGNLSVRDTAKGNIWTTYTLVSDGQAVSFP